MPVRQRTNGWTLVIAIPWRVLVHRFSFLVFMALACGLLVLGRAQPVMVEKMRTHVVDGIAPVLDAIARPMTATEKALSNVKTYLALYDENQKLREANQQLKSWQNAVVTTQDENNKLRVLLHFKPEPRLAYISARVIADTGGSYTRGLIVTAGKTDGVREGMAAMTGDGLVGRVVEVGDWSSRVILITDLNSRVPVSIAGSGERAILAGDNTAQPKLLYLPQDAVLPTGAHVMTSGHGGVFPPNLSIGAVLDTGHGSYSIVPSADLGRISYVQLVDFNLKGGLFNPVAVKVQAETKKR